MHPRGAVGLSINHSINGRPKPSTAPSTIQWWTPDCLVRPFAFHDALRLQNRAWLRQQSAKVYHFRGAAHTQSHRTIRSLRRFATVGRRRRRKCKKKAPATARGFLVTRTGFEPVLPAEAGVLTARRTGRLGDIVSILAQEQGFEP